MKALRLYLGILIATLAFSCNKDEEGTPNMKELKFDGVVKHGDLGTPIPGVKVILTLTSQVSVADFIIKDSTTTDSQGKYAITIRYDRDAGQPTHFGAQPVRAYYESCSDSQPNLIPIGLFVGAFPIDTVNMNTANFFVCPTWEVNILSVKQHPNQVDTLFYSQTLTAAPYGSILTSSVFVTENEKVLRHSYFGPITKTTFHFIIKREDGFLTEWDQEVVRKMYETQTVRIDY
jgi:hypothetical protein